MAPRASLGSSSPIQLGSSVEASFYSPPSFRAYPGSSVPLRSFNWLFLGVPVLERRIQFSKQGTFAGHISHSNIVFIPTVYLALRSRFTHTESRSYPLGTSVSLPFTRGERLVALETRGGRGRPSRSAVHSIDDSQLAASWPRPLRYG